MICKDSSNTKKKRRDIHEQSNRYRNLLKDQAFVMNLIVTVDVVYPQIYIDRERDKHCVYDI